MGNQISDGCSLQSIEKLNLNSQQRQNIDLYIWRASPQTNTYIPRVKLNPQQELFFKKQTLNCIKEKDNAAPNLIFEDYLCDFRQLKSFLDVTQLLSVFKMVLKGHQSIFEKFNASIVSEKCIFLTPNGQIRVWINPNYYLNEFWSVEIQRRQVRSKTQFIHNLNTQTPRFLNREEFQSKSVGMIMSQHILIRKITQLVLNLSKTSEESLKFKTFIENELNFLKIHDVKFSKILFLIDSYAAMCKIAIKNSIEEAVKRLVSQGRVFQAQKCSLRSLKETRKTIHTVDSKHNSTFIRNPTVGRQSNLVSIIDVKTETKPGLTKNLYTFTKTNLHTSVTQKQQQGTTQQTYNFSRLFDQNAFVKHNKPQHKRKLSKSLIQPTIQYETNNIEYVEQVPIHCESFRKKSTPFQEISQAKVKQEPNKKLSFSFQYSINLYTSQTHNPTQKSSKFKDYQLASQTQRSHKYHKKNPSQLSQLSKESMNSKPSSILKKGNSNSFEINKSLNGFLNSARMQKKQKILTFEESIKFENLSDVKNGKQLCVSTFEADNYGDKTVQNSQNLNNKNYHQSDEIIDDLDETKKTTVKNRQLSIGNMWSVQQQRPFEEITKQEIFSGQNAEQNRFYHKTFLNPQARYSINNCRGQTSMLINIKNIDNQKKETLIKSKRRISVGGQGQKQAKVNRSGPNNFLGVNSIEKDQNNNHTSRTVTRLLSSQNILQNSIGSFSSFEESEGDSQASRYTGILTKMGRNVPFKKVSDDYIKEILENQKPHRQTENMPNFTKKKKTIVEIGSNRSMKI